MVFKTFFSGEQPPVLLTSAVQFSCLAIVNDNDTVWCLRTFPSIAKIFA
jgi:hypothetical protein